MIANRAFFRSFRALDTVSAVSAFPNNFGRTFKNLTFNQRVEQGIVSFFVAFFDFGNGLKQKSDFGKAFFVSFLSHAVIHIGPFIIFAGSSIFQIGDSVGNLTVMQQLEPQFGMFFFIVCSLFKLVGNDIIAFFLGLGSIIGIFVAGHRFAGKSIH